MPDQPNGTQTGDTPSPTTPSPSPTGEADTIVAGAPVGESPMTGEAGSLFDKFMSGSQMPGEASGEPPEQLPAATQTPLSPAPAPEPQPQPRYDSRGRPVQTRDYTGLNPTEQEWFKEMGGNAYKNLYPLYKEYLQLKHGQSTSKAEFEKQLAEAQKARFYDVEGAHRLDPEIQELESGINHLNREERHWRQQLANAESPEGQVQMLEWGQDGKLYQKEPEAATPQLRAEIIASLQRCYSLKQGEEQKYNAAVGGYKERYNGFYNSINTLSSQLFDKQMAALKPHVDRYLNAIPPVLRHSPATQFACKAMAALELVIRHNAALEAQLAGKQLNNGARQNSLPADAVGGGQNGENHQTSAQIRQDFKKVYGV